MKTGVIWALLVALIASLVANIYLFNRMNTPVQQRTSAENTVASSTYDEASALDNINGNAVFEHASPFNNNGVIGANENDKNNQTNTFLPYDELVTLLNAQEFESLRYQLALQLQTNPLDEQLLLLEAKLIALTKPLHVAIIHYYDMLDLPLSAAAIASIQNSIDARYENAQQQLKKNRQWTLMATLNEPLFQRITNEKRYILNLATAYAHMKNITLMEDTLASLPFDDADAARIRALSLQAANNNNASTDELFDNGIEPLGNNVTRVPLIKEGDQYRVKVRALNQRAEMIVDTGATTTAITTGLFARLSGYRRLVFVGNFNVKTAAGTIEAPMVQIPKFYFAGYEFTNLSALVLPADVLGESDGLLGMNVLREFDFSLRAQEETLLLKHKMPAAD
ncbi:retroviral-like aspartic protease family protein [Alteromonas sp. A079]|uniref:retroviral-like aspartic protease family protein n=1 Tax=Alteromonas sp. A079 TaxID=3410268 RepID=UPI003BA23DA1